MTDPTPEDMEKAEELARTVFHLSFQVAVTDIARALAAARAAGKAEALESKE